MLKRLLLAALACSALSAPAAAATPQALHAAPIIVPAPVTPLDAMVESHGQVTVAGKSLSYTVRAGLLPIYDNDTGELAARMFVVAYTLDRPPGAPPRPLTFLWNGGPGSSSSQVHLLGFGPKGFATPATYPEWRQPPSRIVDRPETWLTASDLVFVDPIGTGYSRATSQAWRDRLYTTHGDAEAVAEMIRVYRTRFDAFDAPLILAGESYGTIRAAAVAEALAHRRTPVAGVVLISGDYDLGQEVPPALQQALQLPAFTAAAWSHHRLAADLQVLPQAEAVHRAEAWARSDYAPALERLDQLSAEQRTAIVAGVSRFSGVDGRYIDAKTLVLPKGQFADHLLEDRGLELGRYDARLILPRRASSQQWGPREDPSLLPMIDLMEGTSPPLIRYLRDTLGYRSDLLYRGPWGGSFHPDPDTLSGQVYGDDWMAVLWDHGAALRGPPQPSTKVGLPPLRAAMIAEPQMQVFSVLGFYDGYTSCALREEAVAETEPALRSRVRTGCYAAGHMPYTDRSARFQLQQDFTAFVSGLARPTAKP